MRILVAYDGSQFAEAAVSEVLSRPWPAETEVRLVTAIDRPAPPGTVDGLEGFAPLGEAIGARLREAAYRQIRSVLERFAAGRPDIIASYELRDGEPKGALLEAIREWKPDLVVVGSHGKSPLERLLLGSVSHALVSYAPCNVEIVKVPSAA
jgi:nucleotide-binding universal stress UspA family protein